MFQHRCMRRKMKIVPVLCHSHSYLTLQQSWVRWSFSRVCQGQGWLCGEGLLEYSLSNIQRSARRIKGGRAVQAKETTQISEKHLVV